MWFCFELAFCGVLDAELLQVRDVPALLPVRKRGLGHTDRVGCCYLRPKVGDEFIECHGVDLLIASPSIITVVMMGE